MFIVFEGGEGSGKTSAIAALPFDCVRTREPGGTPEGLALRAVLLAEDAPDWDPMAELLLMTAARVQHVARVIRPALAAGQVVVCDRFLGSTLAYQGAGRGLPADFILDLHRRAVGLMPDLTVLLDVAPEIGLRRSVRRLGDARVAEGRFEALDLAFHTRVRADFLARAGDGATVVIDAGADQASVRAAVLGAVVRRLAK